MSIVQVRDAFVITAANNLNLDSLVMDVVGGNKQTLTAKGTYTDNKHTPFNVTTEAFEGSFTIIQRRAVQMALDIVAAAPKASQPISQPEVQLTEPTDVTHPGT